MVVPVAVRGGVRDHERGSADLRERPMIGPVDTGRAPGTGRHPQQGRGKRRREQEDQASKARKLTLTTRPSLATAVLREEMDQFISSTAMAVASPPPMHSDATPRRSPRVWSADSKVASRRAPLAPIGWPSAVAPP